MENLIIITILLAIVVFALLRAKKHFKSGGCCGSKGSTIRVKKTLDAPRIGQKTMTIEGMTCENCEIRVENVLNRLDGVAARVNWKKGKAIVAYSTEVAHEVLRTAVEKMGYKVTRID